MTDAGVAVEPRGDTKQARALWGMSRTWEWASGIHQQVDPIANETDLHHAVAFGALVSEATNNQVRAIARNIAAS